MPAKVITIYSQISGNIQLTQCMVFNPVPVSSYAAYESYEALDALYKHTHLLRQQQTTQYIIELRNPEIYTENLFVRVILPHS